MTLQMLPLERELYDNPECLHEVNHEQQVSRSSRILDASPLFELASEACFRLASLSTLIHPRACRRSALA